MALSPHGLQPPDLLVQILPAKYHIQVEHQKVQQFILPVFKLHLSAVHIDPVSLCVEPNAACLQLGAVLLLGAC